MDKLTKNYIDDIVKPLLNRIQYLQRCNQQLKIKVKYLQSLVLNEKTYAKPTVSAANHMRQSKVSSKGENSPEKRPNWNSKTKIDYVPVVNLQPMNCEIPKMKPPIPRLMRSPSKKQHDEETRNSQSGKKTFGTNFQSIGNKVGERLENNQQISLKMPIQSRQGNQNDEQNPFQQNIGLIKERSAQIGMLNHKFQQLVKFNTEILTSMKQNNQMARENLKQVGATSNYVQKVGAPKSEYNHESQTASPIERSVISQPHPENYQEKIQLK